MWPHNQIIFTLINYSPTILFLNYLVKNKNYQNNHSIILITVFIWINLQFASLAFGRALHPVSSRYTDIIVLGLVMNYVFLIKFLDFSKKLNIFLKYSWLISIILGMSYQMKGDLKDMSFIKAQSNYQKYNITKYIESGEVSYLNNQPFKHIPYPDPARLKMIIDDKTINDLIVRSIFNDNK